MALPLAFGAVITAFFAKIWGATWKFLLFASPWLIEKAIKLIGVSIVTYIGIDLVFDSLETWVFNQFSGVPTDVYQIMVLADLDWAIKVIFAAMVAIMALKPMQSITFKRPGA